MVIRRWPPIALQGLREKFVDKIREVKRALGQGSRYGASKASDIQLGNDLKGKESVHPGTAQRTKQISTPEHSTTPLVSHPHAPSLLPNRTIPHSKVFRLRMSNAPYGRNFLHEDNILPR
ncbi:hypothetical protein ACLMJK_003645 [Lecanora helva]